MTSVTAARTRQRLRGALLAHAVVQHSIAALTALRADAGSQARRYVGSVLLTEACLAGVFSYAELDGFAARGLPLGVPVGPLMPGIEASVGDSTVWLAAEVLARRLRDGRAGQRLPEEDHERQAVSRALRVAAAADDRRAARAHRDWLAARRAKEPAGSTRFEHDLAAEDADRRLAAAVRKRRQRQRKSNE